MSDIDQRQPGFPLPSRRRRSGAGRLALAWAVGLSLAAVAGASAQPAPPAAAAGVTVTFLANEGLLLSTPQHGVLVDACVREPYLEYGAVNDQVWSALLRGAAPFERVDVVLVSHAHRDHFQVEAARELLLARPEVHFVVHEEVAAQLAAQWRDWSRVAARVVAVAPTDGAPVVWSREGVTVTLHRLPHGPARTNPENLAHVVEIGGRRVLHVGDAEATAAQVRATGIDTIDVALLPFWYWLGGQWATAREQFAGRLATLAVHVPPGQEDRALAEVVAPPKVFRRPLESVHYKGRSAAVGSTQAGPRGR